MAAKSKYLNIILAVLICGLIGYIIFSPSPGPDPRVQVLLEENDSLRGQIQNNGDMITMYRQKFDSVHLLANTYLKEAERLKYALNHIKPPPTGMVLDPTAVEYFLNVTRPGADSLYGKYIDSVNQGH